MKRMKLYHSLCAGFICLVSVASAHAQDISVQNGLRDRLAQLELLFPTQGARVAFGAEQHVPLIDRLWYAYTPGQDAAFDLEAGKRATIIRIDGVIEPGATERLQRIIRNHDRIALVISGPGGNFAEAIKLGEFIYDDIGGQDRRIGGVFVLNGTECLSACAVVAAWSLGPYIEHGAKIGFHMPFFPGEQASATAQASVLLNVAYDISLAFTELTLRNLVTADLTRAVYQHRTADSFLLMSEGWQFAENGFRPVAPSALSEPVSGRNIDLDLVSQLCVRQMTTLQSQNASYVDWEFSEFRLSDARNPGQFIGSSTTLVDFLESERLNWFLLLSGTAIGFTDLLCRVGIDEDGLLNVELMNHRLTDCAGPLTNRRTEAACATSRPEVHARVSRYQLLEVLGCEAHGFGRGESRTKDRIDIGRNVNLRAEPSVNSSIVGRLEAGENVASLGCVVTPDTETAWYQVRDNRGIEGWISARFANSPRARNLYQSLFRPDN